MRANTILIVGLLALIMAYGLFGGLGQIGSIGTTVEVGTIKFGDTLRLFMRSTKLVAISFALVVASVCCCYGDLTVERLLIKHDSLGDFGKDVAIAADGVVVLKGGATVDTAAVTFWADMRVRFAAVTLAMQAGGGRVKIGAIGFSFSDKSSFYLNLSKKEVKWSGKLPDADTRLFLDAVKDAYEPSVMTEAITVEVGE